MKNLIAGLLTFGIISQSFAGTLVNKDSKESIIFTLKENDIVSMESRATGFSSKETRLGRVEKTDVKYKTALMALTNEMLDGGNGESIAIAYTFFIPFTLAANAIDVLALPIKGTYRFIRNAQNKKDFKILGTVISTNETVEVSDTRFNRIIDILNR